MGWLWCSSRDAMRSVDMGAALVDLPYPRSDGVSPPHMPNTSLWPALGRVVGLGMCHRSVWLSRSLLCGWLLLGTTVLLGGICTLQHPTRLVSSTCWGFSALWAVFWAPPSDPTHICSVMVHSWCYLFAALVAVLLWCRRLVGHCVVCWLVCWIICLVSVRAARWSSVHEHLIVWLLASLLWSCMTLNLKVLLMVCLQPGHTSSGCVSCKLTAF
jgi:hypothetical protein